MKRLIPLAIGILIAVLVFAFAVKVSNDLRMIYWLGLVLIFAGGTWSRLKGWNGPIAWLGLCVPLITLFEYEMLTARNMPISVLGLFGYGALWALSGLLALVGSPAGVARKTAMVGSALLFAFSIWYVVSILPVQTAAARNHFQSKPAPEFSLQTLDGAPLTAASLKDKVVVLDFFSTTCAPCIEELPQMEQARRELNTRADVHFLLVVSDLGGDTPESIRSYAKERGIDMAIAYDKGAVAHDAFGFVGVPALVVLDKSGSIRLTRQGFNRADSNFRSDLVHFVSSL